jgi:hypothetical protein
MPRVLIRILDQPEVLALWVSPAGLEVLVGAASKAVVPTVVVLDLVPAVVLDPQFRLALA